MASRMVPEEVDYVERALAVGFGEVEPGEG